MCEQISPISDEKCPPHIDGCEQTIKDIAYDKAGSHKYKITEKGTPVNFTADYSKEFTVEVDDPENDKLQDNYGRLIATLKDGEGIIITDNVIDLGDIVNIMNKEIEIKKIFKQKC